MATTRVPAVGLAAGKASGFTGSDSAQAPIAQGATFTPAPPNGAAQAGQYVTSATTPAATTGSGDAYADFVGEYTDLGIGGLADQAWTLHNAGWTDSAILTKARSGDGSAISNEYNTIFPGAAKLLKDGVVSNEGQYTSAIQTFTDASHAYGVNGYSKADYASLLDGGVSTSEWTNRLQIAAQAVNQTDPTDRAQLQRLYGITTGDLTSYWLDPTNSAASLQPKLNAALVAGAADRTGFGDLDQATAEQLANTGVSAAQAAQGFAQIQAQQGALAQLPGQANPGISSAQEIGAQFNGDAASQAAITAQKSARLATFAGSSNVASTATGVAAFAPQR